MSLKMLTQRVLGLERTSSSRHSEQLVVAELDDGSRYVLREHIPDLPIPPDDDTLQALGMTLGEWHRSQPACWRRFRPGLDDAKGPDGQASPRLTIHKADSLVRLGVAMPDVGDDPAWFGYARDHDVEACLPAAYDWPTSRSID